MNLKRLALLMLLGGCASGTIPLDKGNVDDEETGITVDSGLITQDSALDTDDSGEVPVVDEDGDGFAVDDDCDDSNADINPDATEVCDGLDNDCSGQTDEGACTDCTQVTYQDHTYQFCAGPNNWPDAQDQCAMWGYSLTTVEDEAEDLMMNEYISITELGSVWIGLNDRGEENEGEFTWISGLESSYEDGWHPGEPNSYQGNDEDCVEKREGFDGAWNDRTCEDEIAFICEGSF
jgi:hypothetical protein